jgi:hypothetical protein
VKQVPICRCGCGWNLTPRHAASGFVPGHERRRVPNGDTPATAERTCAVCGKPPNARGCVVLYETAGGGEAWMHRLCAAERIGTAA